MRSGRYSMRSPRPSRTCSPSKCTCRRSSIATCAASGCSVPVGIGLITATALSASVGEFDRFPSGRHFASSLGLTPREHSSGNTRRLGRVTKRGDVYLRMLLIHGARAVLRSAKVAAKKKQPLDRTRTWALALCERIGHNKAAVALANKQARRLWAAEHHRQSFDPDHVSAPVALATH